MNWHKWFYEFLYRFSKPRWDSGVTPPDVVAEVARRQGQPGRALDLGCGTGTNSIYLAQHGFQVIGVDFSLKAIEMARQKARQAGVVIDFYINDVTRLDFIREPFDLILDIGCFHNLGPAERARYAENLTRLTCPGGLFMLYAFGPRSSGWRKLGIAEEQVKATFTPQFAAQRIDHGEDHGQLASAWYWFERR
jgi:cyclopropane fatty-acyl-phospholipid synthase-like methyltransferase